ncbi:hypothetical protein [Kitasatospora sp. KL5]|uniref:hypothetical protein n=1 Tax=Kitasatospora sp. KL5 TaxID=3425125 RepID=UPI003D6EF262
MNAAATESAAAGPAGSGPPAAGPHRDAAPGWRGFARRRGATTGAPARQEPAAERSALYPEGPHFVIAAPADGPGGTRRPLLPAALASALARLPAAADALIVVAASPDAAAVLLGHLDELARTAAERGADTLVLAASGLAAPASGRRQAEQVAARAGLPVVAPDGTVTLRADGTLAATAPEDGGPATWWYCPPAGPARALGPIWPPAPAADGPPAGRPAPETAPPKTAPPKTAEPESAEPETAPPETAGPAPSALPHGLATTPLAAGQWITTEPVPPGTPVPGALHRAAAADDTLVLVVGRPGERLPDADRLADAVRPLLPSPDTDLLLSAPWTGVADLAHLAAGLSAELARDVRAAVGLPMRTAAGFSSRVLDTDGVPSWEPWLTELTASAELRRVVPSAWRTAPAPLAHRGPALFDSEPPGWCVEAVPAGLWLRPPGPVQDHGPRRLDPDPAAPLLVVGADRQPVPPEATAAAERLLTALARQGAAEPRQLVRGLPPAVGRTDPAAAPGETPPSSGAPQSPHPVSGHREKPDPRRQPVPQQRHEGGRASSGAPSHPDHAHEQAAFRALVGSHFRHCAARADLAATRLPTLRSSGPDDLRTDLAAVYLHHADTGVPASRADLVDAARRPAPGPLAPYLACLASGLRRLPSHHGPLLLGARAGEDGLRHYLPGKVLTDPAPVVGLPAHDVELGVPVEFAVWSFTGRRTAVFVEDEESEVVFLPGTRFAVLDVLPGGDGVPTRVLLRESALRPTTRQADADTADGLEQHLRKRLLTWLGRRDSLTPQERRVPTRPSRYHLAPGLSLS